MLQVDTMYVDKLSAYSVFMSTKKLLLVVFRV